MSLKLRPTRLSHYFSLSSSSCTNYECKEKQFAFHSSLKYPASATQLQPSIWWQHDSLILLFLNPSLLFHVIPRYPFTTIQNHIPSLYLVSLLRDFFIHGIGPYDILMLEFWENKLLAVAYKVLHILTPSNHYFPLPLYPLPNAPTSWICSNINMLGFQQICWNEVVHNRSMFPLQISRKAKYYYPSCILKPCRELQKQGRPEGLKF